TRFASQDLPKAIHNCTTQMPNNASTGFDLGLTGRTALVCGSSAGLGRACAEALVRSGTNVVLNGRNPERLARTAAEIAALGQGRVIHVVADVTTPEGREALLSAVGTPDILVNNSAGPRTGDFHDFDESTWERALAANMIAPIMLMRGVIDGMIARRWGRIIN